MCLSRANWGRDMNPSWKISQAPSWSKRKEKGMGEERVRTMILVSANATQLWDFTRGTLSRWYQLCCQRKKNFRSFPSSYPALLMVYRGTYNIRHTILSLLIKLGFIASRLLSKRQNYPWHFQSTILPLKKHCPQNTAVYSYCSLVAFSMWNHAEHHSSQIVR